MSVSACIEHRGAESQPVAFAEQFIDEMNRPPAGTRWTPRAERCFETGIGGRRLPHPPAHQAFGLAGKVCKGRIEGLEPADEAMGIDQSVSGFGPGGSFCRPHRRSNGYEFTIGIEKVDAGDSPLGISAARQHDTGLRVKKLEGGT